MIQALPGVGRVQQPIELRSRSAEATGQLSAAEFRMVESTLCLQRQFVGQQLGQEARVLVVLKRVIDVHGSFRPGLENIGHSFAAKFLIDEYFHAVYFLDFALDPTDARLLQLMSGDDQVFGSLEALLAFIKRHVVHTDADDDLPPSTPGRNR